MTIPTLKFLLGNPTLIIVFWLLGKTLFYTLKIQITAPYKRSFFECLAGAMMAVFFTAISCTNFRTIFCLFLLPAIFILYEYYRTASKRIYSFNVKQDVFVVIQFVVITLIFTGYKLFILAGEEYSINGDQVIYAKQSARMLYLGIETYKLEPIYTQNMGLTPYHYFELWLNSFIFYFFQIPSVYALTFSTHIIGITVSWLGFCAVIEHYNLKKTSIFFGSLVMILFAGVYLPMYKHLFLLNTSINFSKNILDTPKLLATYWFILAFFIAFLSNKKGVSYFILLFLVISYVTLLPSIIGGVMLYLFYYALINPKKRLIHIKYLFAYIFFLIVFIVFYYFLQVNSNSQSNSLISIIFTGIDFKYVKTFVNIIIGASIQLFILYLLPLCIVLWVFLNKYIDNKDINFEILTIIFCCFMVGVFSWAILHKIPDSLQLINNLTPALFSTSFATLFAYINHKMGTKIWKINIFFLIVILLNILHSHYLVLGSVVIHERGFLQEVHKNLKSINKTGVYIMEKKDYSSIFVKGTEVNLIGQYMNLKYDLAHAVPLSVFEMPITSSLEKSYLQNSTFYKFVDKQKKESKFLNISQSQLDFIVENKIGYMILPTKAAIPDKILPLVKRVLQDNVTKERFIVFKK